mmetsp:Transcript_127411/g.345777  ORF Transcript_127411/g.345777 Transcript_127411/m.345777 type:complete len:222 (+) Transcript_127411:634-1299(+)
MHGHAGLGRGVVLGHRRVAAQDDQASPGARRRGAHGPQREGPAGGARPRGGGGEAEAEQRRQVHAVVGDPAHPRGRRVAGADGSANVPGPREDLDGRAEPRGPRLAARRVMGGGPGRLGQLQVVPHPARPLDRRGHPRGHGCAAGGAGRACGRLAEHGVREGAEEERRRGQGHRQGQGQRQGQSQGEEQQVGQAEDEERQGEEQTVASWCWRRSPQRSRAA